MKRPKRMMGRAAQRPYRYEILRKDYHKEQEPAVILHILGSHYAKMTCKHFMKSFNLNKPESIRRSRPSLNIYKKIYYDHLTI